MPMPRLALAHHEHIAPDGVVITKMARQVTPSPARLMLARCPATVQPNCEGPARVHLNPIGPAGVGSGDRLVQGSVNGIQTPGGRVITGQMTSPVERFAILVALHPCGDTFCVD